MWFYILIDFIRNLKNANFKKYLTRKCVHLFWFLMKKKVRYLYFCHIYMRTRVAVLCYPGSVCQRWMTEIMWFLSILILTGAPFQKGQEWQGEKFSRECFRTCLKTWSSLTHLIVLGCWGKAAPGELRTWSGIQTSRTTKLASQAQSVRLRNCWNHAGEGWGPASLEVTCISLSFSFPLCAEYFFAHLSYL